MLRSFSPREQQLIDSDRRLHHDLHSATRQLVQHAFERARAIAWRRSFWRRLGGHTNKLYDLAALRANGQVRGQQPLGVRQVPLDAIVASEGRIRDFDAAFWPRNGRTRARWEQVAAAWHRGESLPPVMLVQVADHYAVRDGHHRISVARAFGATSIAADVVVWDVCGFLVLERPAAMGWLVLQQRLHLDFWH